jgi:hypothetical protein
MTHHCVLAALGVVTALGSLAQAEEPSPYHNAISFSVGLASGSEAGGRRDFLRRFEGRRGFEHSATGGVLGGTLLRDLSDRLAFEASGAYLDRGASHGVSAMGQLLVMLIDGGKAVPYLSAGGGIYHTSSERFIARAGIHLPRAVRGPRGQHRGDASQTNKGSRFEEARSTDPALSLGGGVRLDLGPRFYARPDARLMTVMGGGHNQAFGLFTLNLGWRF